MVTASHLATALGRKNLAMALGVGQTAISNATSRGWFPASWYVAMKALADAAQCECPPELFRMKTRHPQYVNTIGGFQGGRAFSAPAREAAP